MHTENKSDKYTIHPVRVHILSLFLYFNNPTVSLPMYRYAYDEYKEKNMIYSYVLSMLAKVHSVSIIGLECEEVLVEVDVLPGLPYVGVVGLADTAVQEAKERIRSSIRNSGSVFPMKRVIVNLAPADMRKKSPYFDLPMAVGVLIATGQADATHVDEVVFVGELALDGRICHVQGVLSIVMFAKQRGYRKIIVPLENREEASLIEGIEIIACASLSEVIEFLKTGVSPRVLKRKKGKISMGRNEKERYDMAHIRGQFAAKRALEIAASGGHNLLLNGPPGSGKSMLAKVLQSILPNMTIDEAIGVTRVYSIAGLLPKGKPLIEKRPFRSIHHTASHVSIVGGGRIPRPGEISLAHKGVLFMDELPEFPKEVLEVLRQPLEDRTICVSRALGSYTYPASFMFVAAMNPCPCGYATDRDRECLCSPFQIERYQKKISGPLLDRIDMYVEVPRVEIGDMVHEADNRTESSYLVRERVEMARTLQRQRFIGEDYVDTNAEMDNEDIQKFCLCTEDAKRLLETTVQSLKLSARAYFRILKVARTIADLASTEYIQTSHIGEAISYRKR